MGNDSKRIEIPQPTIDQVILRLVGITPYLSNAFPDRVLLEMENDREKRATPKRLPTPDEHFEASIHRDGAGRPSIPAAAVHKSMVSAGQRFAGGNKKLFGTELRGWFSVLAELLPIDGPEPKMHRTVARAKGAGRKPMPRYRAVFDPWAVDVPLSFNADLISLEQLINLAVLAGEGVGVGDWRKELSGGTGAFGVFTVEVSGPGTAR